MGTQSLTRVHDVWCEGKDEILVNMYRQSDGHPRWHGKDLVEFMQDRTIGNGIPYGKELGKFSNGPGCFAAQLVANFKIDDVPGGFYLYPSDTIDCGQEYEYDIYIKDSKDIRITVKSCVGEIFNGNFEDFKSFCDGSQKNMD